MSDLHLLHHNSRIASMEANTLQKIEDIKLVIS